MTPGPETAEHRRLREARDGPRGGAGARTSANASGEPSARTTARTATPGRTSPTTRRGPGRTAGARTGSPGSPTTATAVLRARALERQRPDPQGAAVRPDQQRGQPRRGREGVLLLPRRHANALLPALPLQVPAGGVPLRRPRQDERRTVADEPEYELLDTGVFDEDRYFDVLSSTRRPPRRTCSCGSRPTTAARTGRRCTSCRRSGSATRGRGRQHDERPRAPRRSPATCRRWSRRAPDPGRAAPRLPRRARAPLHRERDQYRAAAGRPEPEPYVKDGIDEHVVTRARGRREPGAGGDEGRGALRTRGGARRLGGGPAPAPRAGPRRHAAPAALGPTFGPAFDGRCGAARPTSSTAPSSRRASTTTRPS